MTSQPCERNADSSKLVENRTIVNHDDYIPISKFYNGRSIFITGGNFHA